LRQLEVIPVGGLPEVEPGSDLARLILGGLAKSRVRLEENDVVVVKQKVVSKAEGRLVKLADVHPGPAALELAKKLEKDPRLVQVVLSEATRIVRTGHGVIITETRQGFVCANSGVDQSNVKGDYVTLLPSDPDASAKKIREVIEAKTRRRVAVVITDTFGRPWRKGQTDVAIGCSGISPLRSYKGKNDTYGHTLKVTEPAVVDEIAAASELVTGKLSRIPVAIVRGARYARSESGVKAVILERERDLFR